MHRLRCSGIFSLVVGNKLGHMHTVLHFYHATLILAKLENLNLQSKFGESLNKPSCKCNTCTCIVQVKQDRIVA